MTLFEKVIKSSRTIYPVSLGCAKNKSDFEKLLYILKERGIEPVLLPEEADLIWINTCAFIRPAVQEAIDHILELGSIKKRNQKLVVSGCLPARYGEKKLEELLPEVDFFLGIEPFKHFLDDSRRYPVERILTENPFYAYVKIAEGCSHRCSYCTIPFIRGTYRSLPQKLIIEEVTYLLSLGVKEIILVAQDTAFYGKDLKDQKTNLLGLLKEISKIEESFRIRLLYLNPQVFTISFVEEVLSIDKVVPYFDIPLQHVSSKILKKMRRFYQVEKILETMEYLRKHSQISGVRTTIMVGFPGEEDKEFEELRDFVRMVEFDYLGVFIFYPEEGTEAERFPERVPYKEKLRRKREILKIQREITRERLKKREGQNFEVLVLGEDIKGKPFGIAPFQCPEIDGLTYVKGKREGLAGEIIKVKALKPYYFFDLIAEEI